MHSSKYELTSLGNSIIRIKVFPGVELEKEDAVEMRKGLLLVSSGKKYAVLLDATETFSTSNEARTLIASKEYSFDRIATVMLIGTLANRLVANFFIKVNKPHSPTKIFSLEAAGVAWLLCEVEAYNKKND